MLSHTFQPETVDEQQFLTAAMENKLPMVEKYLSDGGNPNMADHVSSTPPPVSKKHTLSLIMIMKSCPVPENGSAQSVLQRTRGRREKTAGGRSRHRQKRQGETLQSSKTLENKGRKQRNVCVFQLESTAVHWACRGGSLAALQLLLDHGAQFTYRDKVGVPPAHFGTI